jgi:hypothetical protein
MGIIAGLSHGLTNRPAFRMADALMVGLIGGLISGLVTWIIDAMLFKVLRTEGGMAVLNWLALRWRQWLIGGVVAASVPSVLMGWGQIRVIQAIYIVCVCLGLGMVFALTGSFLIALMGAAIGAAFGGLVGALFGTLSEGITGIRLTLTSEIERRTVPNQGIRRSALNVGVFALVGGLTLGTIWGLLNLSVGVLMTGVIPEAFDWLRFQLSGVLFLGSSGNHAWTGGPAEQVTDKQI